MPTETLERFPKTVSSCHAEIIRLRKELQNADGARVVELEGERDKLQAELDTAREEIGDLEEKVEELEEDQHPDIIDAVDQFLYEVERPVGQFKFDVIHGPAADRAILRLFDVVGRQP